MCVPQHVFVSMPSMVMTRTGPVTLSGRAFELLRKSGTLPAFTSAAECQEGETV